MAASKFKQDVSWNLVSFVVLGISGVLLNTLIARYYDAATLGVFNLAFAIYFFLSQIGVFGLHLSASKHISEDNQDMDRISLISWSSLYLTVVFSILVTVAAGLMTDTLGIFFSSPELARAWLWILPGLFFFSINKTLLGILNGLRHMRAFAIWQGARYLLLLVGIIGTIILDFSADQILAVISFTESIVFIGLFIHLILAVPPSSFFRSGGWYRQHLRFGARGVMGGAIIDLNSKVDILMLGYFMTDKAVGLYSMAALVIEGISQVSIVLRNNINPILSRRHAQNDIKKLKSAIAKGVKQSYLLFLGLTLLGAICYPLFLHFFIGSAEFDTSIPVFIILSCGLFSQSGYLPFSMLLTQAGSPGSQTILFAGIMCTNILFNMVLIPVFGMTGAAVGTALSMGVSVLWLKVLVRTKLGIRI